MTSYMVWREKICEEMLSEIKRKITLPVAKVNFFISSPFDLCLFWIFGNSAHVVETQDLRTIFDQKVSLKSEF